jgi:hypothetical protein
VQEKIDKLEIIKGFPKIVCQYFVFSPEKYKKRKEELKIDRNYCEIYIPRLLMEEKADKFEELYGAYCMFGDPPSWKQEHINQMYRHGGKDEKEAIYENGDIIKFKKGEKLREPD